MENRLLTRHRPRPGPAFHLARSSLKKIHAVIRAYYIIGRSATLEEVESESRLSHEAVSNMQGFLVDLGILMGGQRRRQLCPVGTELGKAIKSGKGDAAVNRIWKRVVCSNGFCLRVLRDARAEGKLDKNRFIYLVFTAAGSRPRDLSHDYTAGSKALISIFKRAGYVRRTGEYSIVCKSIERLVENQRNEFKRDDDYISQDHISRLERIEARGGGEYDLSKLIIYCHELNDNYRRGNTLSVRSLSRAVVDHVRPIFGMPAPEAFEPHAAVGKTAETSSDLLLVTMPAESMHRRASALETAPAPEEVNFKAVMDRLISRVIEEVEKNVEPGENRT